ncbi:MAG TPA: YncE family protein [Pyrinomonadaceae bacterium]|nr:YncE family protein [Pyrinomonadaceae bacterium]
MLQTPKLNRRLSALFLLAASLLLCAARPQAQTHLFTSMFEREVYNVAVDPATNLVYAPSGSHWDARLGVLDWSLGSPASDVKVSYIPLPTDSYPLEVAVNPMARRVYATDYFSNRLLVVDAAAGTYLTAVALGARPRDVAVNAATGRVYVTLPEANQVQVIDGGTNTLSATVVMPEGCGTPYAMAVDSSSGRVFVTSLAGSSVCVVEGDAVVATAYVGRGPYSIAANPATGRVYVANKFDGTVSVIRASDASHEATFTVSFLADGVAVNPTTDRVYVTDSWRRMILVMDGDPASATYHMSLGYAWGPERMYDIAVNPSTNVLYVASGMMFVYHDPPPSPAAQLAALIEKVQGMNLAQGIANSLDAKLGSARAALDSARGGDAGAACHKLEAFAGEVRAQADKGQLTQAQADGLVRAADRIRAALGCECSRSVSASCR